MKNHNGPDRMHQQFKLRDGRRLGFAEYGDAGGKPVFYFHGWPGSRLEARALDATAGRLGARVLAVDRPGYGLSDMQEDRMLLDWASDIDELATGLGLDRFAILGVSGGGPYAMACAARLPRRLSGVLLLCALGPTDVPDATKGMVAANRWMLAVGRTAPWLARTLVRFGLEHFRNNRGEILPPQILQELPESDRQALRSREFYQALDDGFREGLRNDVEGALWDGSLYARPWGFKLEKVAVPVQLWHGEADTIVPVGMGRHYASVLPNCRAAFYPGEGHFSMLLKYMREVIEQGVRL